MATTRLPPDFKEFLQLLSKNHVEYLLIGGYAVSHYGYVRATADMDVWLAANPTNAAKAASSLREFGFDVPELSEELFHKPNTIVRMGVPPFRIELFNSISGVDFEECYRERVIAIMDEVPVPVIGLGHLRANKLASGRGKDIVDLEHLP